MWKWDVLVLWTRTSHLHISSLAFPDWLIVKLLGHNPHSAIRLLIWPSIKIKNKKKIIFFTEYKIYLYSNLGFLSENELKTHEQK